MSKPEPVDNPGGSDELEVLYCEGRSETRLVHYRNDFDDSYCYTELEEGYNDLKTLHVAQVYDADFDNWKPLIAHHKPQSLGDGELLVNPTYREKIAQCVYLGIGNWGLSLGIADQILKIKPQPTADAGELVPTIENTLADHILKARGLNLGQYVTEYDCSCGEKLLVDGHVTGLIEVQTKHIAVKVAEATQSHFQHQADQLRRECEAEVVAAEDRGFREGQRVGQYQAADKLYHHTTTMWLFKDDLAHPNANMSERIFEMNKSCEKLLNHNSKVYTAYVSGDRYKRMHPKEYPTNQPTTQENTHE